MQNKHTIFILIFFISVLSACKKDRVIINKVEVTSLESVSFSPNKIDFNRSNDSVVLFFENMGENNVGWKLSSYDPFIGFNKQSGMLDIGEKDSVVISIAMENISQDSLITKISLSINKKDLDIPISVNNLSSNKVQFHFDIVDADYNPNNNTMLLVSEVPSNLLRILDAENMLMDSIKLNYSPLCLSISPDGSKAIVGHDAHVTYIDIQNKSIIKEVDVNCRVSDIVLGNKDWAYAFSSDVHGEFNINLKDESSFQHTAYYQIRKGTKAKLHPSGDYIYGTTNGSYPGDIEKYDIMDDTLEYMYESPYHGEYDIGQDFWISNDGLRIYAKSGYVFKSSEVESNDLLYNGRLDNANNIISLCHSSEADRLYVINSISNWGSPPKTQLLVYDAKYLNFLENIVLDKFKKPDGVGGFKFYDSMGRYVFVNSSTRHIYVISQAVEGAGLLYDWGFEKIKME